MSLPKLCTLQNSAKCTHVKRRDSMLASGELFRGSPSKLSNKTVFGGDSSLILKTKMEQLSPISHHLSE